MIKNELTIGLLQSNLIWEDKKSNLSSVEKQIADIQKNTIDLLVLPEMFNSGFSMNTALLAETMEGETVQFLKSLAKEKNCAVVGSAIIEENNHYYNRLLFVESNGNITPYDKKHLFTLMGEQNHLAAGKQKTTVTFLGWKISFFICYDLRFPVWCNNDKQSDLTVFVANWPAKRVHHWDTLLQARAIENQCYVAATNRVGADGQGNAHNGHSAVIDYKGEVLTNISEEEALIIQTIQKDQQDEHRKRYPFLNDNDKYSIIKE